MHLWDEYTSAGPVLDGVVLGDLLRDETATGPCDLAKAIRAAGPSGPTTPRRPPPTSAPSWLRLLDRRARRVFFDWFAEHSFAIADYAKAGPPRPTLAMEPIRVTVLVSPTVEA